MTCCCFSGLVVLVGVICQDLSKVTKTTTTWPCFFFTAAEFNGDRRIVVHRFSGRRLLSKTRGDRGNQRLTVRRLNASVEN